MLRKTAGTFLVKVIVAITNLVIAVCLSRMFGATGKGEASLIITGIAMVMLFCNMIGGASLIYMVPRYNIFLLATISNCWSIIICAVAYILLSLITIIPSQFILHVCLLTLINSCLSTNLSVLLGKERIGLNNILLLLQAIINLTILVGLEAGFNRGNIDAYIVSVYVAYSTCFLISTIFILPFLKEITFNGFGKIFKSLAKFGFTNQLGHIMSFASFRVSYFLLSNHIGNAGVGVYSNGASLIESILLISNSIATVQYSTISNTNNKSYSQELTIRLVRISILLCLIALIPLLLLPGSFFAWLFGEEFRGVKNVIFILAPGILFYNVALIVGHYFSGTGKYIVNTTGNFAGLVVTVILSSFFISSYSIPVAASIATAAYITTTITVLLYFSKEAKINLMQLIPRAGDIMAAKDKVTALARR